MLIEYRIIIATDTAILDLYTFISTFMHKSIVNKKKKLAILTIY